MRPIGQVVKIPPSHGGVRGSNPLWVTISDKCKRVRLMFHSSLTPSFLSLTPFLYVYLPFTTTLFFTTTFILNLDI